MTYSIIQKSQLEGVQRIDAEYYQPEYLELVDRLKNTQSKKWEEIDGRFITGPFGSEFNVENYVENGKYRYVRGKDVKEFFLQENDNVYVPENDFYRLNKYVLGNGDILVSVVGTVGNTSIVDDSSTPAIFSCKSTAFRTKAINPYYFIAYLNSNYGKKLLIRSVRGHVQTGLNINDLKSLLVFTPSTDKQDQIGNLVIESRKIGKKSKNLYQQAEDLLLEELGLKDFEEQHDLFSIVNYSEVKEAERIDAEYFQNKFDLIDQKLGKFKQKNLDELCSLISYGTVPTSPYVDKGIPYVKGENLKDCFVDYSKLVYLDELSIKRLDERHYLKEDDIIISQMGTVGNASLVTKKEAGWTFASFTIRARLSDKAKEILSPLFLTFYIQNIARPYYLLRRIAQASVRQNTDLPTIRSLKVPMLPIKTQQKIADLVRESHTARQKSKELLAEAKRKVAALIESEPRHGREEMIERW